MKPIVAFVTALLQVHFVLADSLTAPVQPTYETCNVSQSQLVYDEACVARNQQKEKDYQTALAAYNEAIKLQATAAASSTDTTSVVATATSTGSATSLLQEAEQKNKSGSAIYKVVGAACLATSGVFMGLYAASCSTICKPPLLYKSMAFAAFSALAFMQSGKHDQVAYQACQSANQISSSGSNCGTDPSTTGTTSTGTTNPTGTTSVTSVINPDGTCVQGQEQACQAVIDSLPPGTNIKDALKGLSGFASAGKSAPYKVNADGSITTKDGKTLKPSDFSNQAAMIAAGLSPLDAAALASSLKKSGIGADGALDAKSALASENDANKNAADGAGALGAEGAIKLTDGGINGDSKNGNLDSDKDKNKRNVASTGSSAEGLVKDFNGELIGASGDDIFKMMNRRYNLKVSQDSFIAP